jgi:hypothetical protein
MDPNYHYIVCGDGELYFKDIIRGTCFTRLQNVSDELNTFLGEPKGAQISYANVVKRVVAYIKEKGLLEKSIIHADSSLLALLNPSVILGEDETLTVLNLPKCLRNHVSEISPKSIPDLIREHLTNKFYDVRRAISEVFYTYSSPDSEPDRNTDKYIEFVLNLGDNAQHFEVRGGTGTFRIVRVLKEMADYTSVAERPCKGSYEGCEGFAKKENVTINRDKAIADLTKKTLEDPTSEKLAYLKMKIAFFETVTIEEVMTPFSSEHEY